jgi:Flp pilus assembly pilin Flp
MKMADSKSGQKEVKVMKKFISRMKKQSGQSLVEYALILALISVVAILVLRGIGTGASTKLGVVNSELAK